MKYLKYFETEAAYASYKNGSDYVLPNVSYVEETKDVSYNPFEEPKSPNLVCTYNVTDISYDIRILAVYGSRYVTNMIVDGIEMEVETYYQFDTVGNHVVEFVLDDPTSIGDKAFTGCNNLTSITIPDSVTSIGENAFSSCSGLTSINIPDSVTTIENGSFSNCYNLTSIVVSKGNTVYDSRENCNCIINTATNTLIQGCNNSFIPDSVTTIGDNAFGGCLGLTAINIPDSVTTIGYDAFGGCDNLTSITIPDSVVTIGDNAFDSCDNLTSIVIGSGVTSIDYRVFNSCYSLNEITCNALIAPMIYSSTFQDIKRDGVLKVPSGSDYSSWMSTDWAYLGYYNWTIEYI